MYSRDNHAFMKKLFCVSLLVGIGFFGVLSDRAYAAGAGDLVKCPDYSSVYYLGEDEKRYMFPDEQTFGTWYSDFDAVKEISCEDMGSLPLGGGLPYQAGTQLLKVQSDPTVYAVAFDGTLRAIDSEEQAESLYGDEWAGMVNDISDAFWGFYDVGMPLEDGELPAGMVVEQDGDLFRVDETGVLLEFDDVLSEEREDLFKGFSHDFSAVEERMMHAFEDDKFDVELMALDASTMEMMFETMMDDMKVVWEEDWEEHDAEYSFGELNSVIESDEFDRDGDGLMDYWEESFVTWEMIGHVDEDADGVSDWMSTSVGLWTDSGYDEYFGEYHEVYEGEVHFDDWADEYDEVWVNHDYDAALEEMVHEKSDEFVEDGDVIVDESERGTAEDVVVDESVDIVDVDHDGTGEVDGDASSGSASTDGTDWEVTDEITDEEAEVFDEVIEVGEALVEETGDEDLDAFLEMFEEILEFIDEVDEDTSGGSDGDVEVVEVVEIVEVVDSGGDGSADSGNEGNSQDGASAVVEVNDVSEPISSTDSSGGATDSSVGVSDGSVN